MKTILLGLFLYACCSSPLQAQGETVTESELTVQGRFLKAKQAALIGQIDEAISLFSALAEDDDRNDAIQFELGRLYFSKEETNTAIGHLEKAWELDQQDAYAYFLSEVYESAGRYSEGAELMASLIERRPDEVDLYLAQIDFLKRGQLTDEAIKVYDKLEKRLGVTPFVSRGKHGIYLETGDQRKAERELLKLIDAFPTRMDYRHLLAGYYQSQNQAAKEKATYEEILRLEPSDVRAQLALKAEGPAAGNSDELLALLSRSDVELDLKIGRLLSMVQSAQPGMDPAAQTQLDGWLSELVRVHPDEAKALALQADHYYLTGRFNLAADAYDRALELEEDVYAVWEQFFVSLYLDQQMEKLHDRGMDGLDVFPNRPRLYLYSALAEASRANYAEAEGLVQEAKRMSRSSEQLTQEVGRLEWLLTKLQNEEDQTITPSVVGQDPFSDYLQARVLLVSGKVEEAYNLLTAAAHDRNTNALWLELLGDAQSATGRSEEAATSYERAKAAGSRSTTLSGKLRNAGGR
ncbi:MAG: tetratricopeptide repeat protein [Bacteroidota bacterium]